MRTFLDQVAHAVAVDDDLLLVGDGEAPTGSGPALAAAHLRGAGPSPARVGRAGESSAPRVANVNRLIYRSARLDR
jgi:hypothetical protein